MRLEIRRRIIVVKCPDMKSTLYVIGVGPGDPELLTLKAARILREAPCLCVPKGREEGSSLALSIIKDTVPLEGKEIIEAHFPMMKTRKGPGSRGKGPEETQENPDLQTADSSLSSLDPGPLTLDPSAELDAKWNETVESVLSRLNRGIDVAFITIGDPTIYSTYFYLHDRLLRQNPGLRIEIIPGVSSINASAARAGVSLSLANEKIAILPANYIEDIRTILRSFDTVVLMKVSKVFAQVRELLNEMGLKGIYVAKAGMADERIIHDLNRVTEEDLNYFSQVIIKR